MTKHTGFFVVNAGGAFLRAMPGHITAWVQHIGKANLFTSKMSAEYSKEKHGGLYVLELDSY